MDRILEAIRRMASFDRCFVDVADICSTAELIASLSGTERLKFSHRLGKDPREINSTAAVCRDVVMVVEFMRKEQREVCRDSLEALAADLLNKDCRTNTYNGKLLAGAAFMLARVRWPDSNEGAPSDSAIARRQDYWEGEFAPDPNDVVEPGDSPANVRDSALIALRGMQFPHSFADVAEVCSAAREIIPLSRKELRQAATRLGAEPAVILGIAISARGVLATVEHMQRMGKPIDRHNLEEFVAGINISDPEMDRDRFKLWAGAVALITGVRWLGSQRKG